MEPLCRKDRKTLRGSHCRSHRNKQNVTWASNAGCGQQAWDRAGATAVALPFCCLAAGLCAPPSPGGHWRAFSVAHLFSHPPRAVVAPPDTIPPLRTPPLRTPWVSLPPTFQQHRTLMHALAPAPVRDYSRSSK